MYGFNPQIMIYKELDEKNLGKAKSTEKIGMAQFLGRFRPKNLLPSMKNYCSRGDMFQSIDSIFVGICLGDMPSVRATLKIRTVNKLQVKRQNG